MMSMYSVFVPSLPCKAIGVSEKSLIRYLYFRGIRSTIFQSCGSNHVKITKKKRKKTFRIFIRIPRRFLIIWITTHIIIWKDETILEWSLSDSKTIDPPTIFPLEIWWGSDITANHKCRCNSSEIMNMRPPCSHVLSRSIHNRPFFFYPPFQGLKRYLCTPPTKDDTEKSMKNYNPPPPVFFNSVFNIYSEYVSHSHHISASRPTL